MPQAAEHRCWKDLLERGSIDDEQRARADIRRGLHTLLVPPQCPRHTLPAVAEHWTSVSLGQQVIRPQGQGAGRSGQQIPRADNRHSIVSPVRDLRHKLPAMVQGIVELAGGIRIMKREGYAPRTAREKELMARLAALASLPVAAAGAAAGAVGDAADMVQDGATSVFKCVSLCLPSCRCPLASPSFCTWQRAPLCQSRP